MEAAQPYFLKYISSVMILITLVQHVLSWTQMQDQLEARVAVLATAVLSFAVSLSQNSRGRYLQLGLVVLQQCAHCYLVAATQPKREAVFLNYQASFLSSVVSQTSLPSKTRLAGLFFLAYIVASGVRGIDYIFVVGLLLVAVSALLLFVL